jgi:DNA-binding winged helix-turn-helix (wHTH) protein
MTGNHIQIVAGDLSYRLDIQAQEIHLGAECIKLTRQQWNLLNYFIASGRTLRTKDDLQVHVWKRRAVNDEAIAQAVRALRSALKDDGEKSRLIETVHGKGYRFIAEIAHSLSLEHPRITFNEDSRKTKILAPPGPIVPISYKWNQPKYRKDAILQFSEKLSGSPIAETSFVDYFHTLDDADAAFSEGDMYIATAEFNEVWDDESVYLPYEAMLVRHRNTGRVPRRLFLVDTAKLKDFGYKARFQRILFRHEELKLSPRIWVLRDARRDMRRIVGIDCDTYSVVKLEYALLVKLNTGQEPAMLKTSNRPICKLIRDFLHEVWKDEAFELNKFDSYWGSLDESCRREVEKEAAYINRIAEFMGAQKGL